MELADEVLNGDIRSIGRAISLVENNSEQKEVLIDTLFPHCGNAQVLGITGPPGAGKSTLLDKLIAEDRQKGFKVAVIAIDPSSPFSGGAILGDRLRMQKHATDDGVFIRSMASRGHLGGVSGGTADAIKIFDSAGYDKIYIETIGVGQTEVDVMALSDIVLLILVPGMGDEIQALKAGVMEIGDIFVVNKSDKPDADKLKAEIEYVLSLKRMDSDTTENPVIMTSATENTGIQALTHAIDSYSHSIHSNGLLKTKRTKRLKSEIRTFLGDKVMEMVDYYLSEDSDFDTQITQVLNREKSPYSLINDKLNGFLRRSKLK